MRETVSKIANNRFFRETFFSRCFLYAENLFFNEKADQILIGFLSLSNVLKISSDEYLQGFTADLMESATCFF